MGRREGVCRDQIQENRFPRIQRWIENYWQLSDRWEGRKDKWGTVGEACRYAMKRRGCHRAREGHHDQSEELFPTGATPARNSWRAPATPPSEKHTIYRNPRIPSLPSRNDPNSLGEPPGCSLGLTHKFCVKKC